MTDTSEIQLNLTTKSYGEDKPKKRRVEQDEADDEEQHPSVKSPEKKKPKKNHQKGEKHEGHDGAAKKDGFVSSLFNHNPEIPKLNLTNIKPQTELVFSAKTFAETGVHPYISKALSDQGMETLTLVQSKAIPVVLGGKDALIKSQTGSGKTLAYAVPILHKLQEERPEVTRGDGVRALILVPTRELAVQTFEWMQKLCRSFTRIVPGVLSGGEKKKSEKARLRKGINILIATPGRLIDHIRLTSNLSLKKVSWLVLDEADRALELGYERDVRAILTALDEQQKPEVEESETGSEIKSEKGQHCSRQTLLCSATLTTGIEQLSEISLRHPVFVDAATDDTHTTESLTMLTTPTNLRQNFIIIPAKLRLVILASFVLWKCRFGPAKKLLIFFATQDMVDFHSELFDRCLNRVHDEADDGNNEDEPDDNWTADAKRAFAELEASKVKKEAGSSAATKVEKIHLLKLHGSMTQKDRMETFRAFREASSGVLLCTDVAARGLDLPQVDWIVQYNAPTTKADYVHRVGRTARIGAKGSALLFVLPSEAEFIRDLESNNLLLAELTIDHVLQKLFRNSSWLSRRPNTMEEAATSLQMKMETAVTNDMSLHQAACQAYVSFVRSYASYPKEIREIFSFKALHLGHLAKSFALRDPPTKITGIGKGKWVQKAELKKKDDTRDLKKEERIIHAQRKRINQKSLVLSEFSSGFEGIDNTILGGTKKETKVKRGKKTFTKRIK